ncbi:MAG TPA: sulfite exporter TauE/SafE family protein [Nocardioidaceae bacterium]|nr:sulfite exporter TauE/SafE family protein [Nocardioidaceae bacterium]
MTELLVVAFVVVVFGSAAQTLTGFGIALVTVPLLALMIDPHTAVVAVTTMNFGLSAWVSTRERAHVRWRSAGVVTAASLVGIPVGLYVLTAVTPRALNIVIGVVVLLFAALLALRLLRLPRGAHVEAGAGAVSGALLAATGMNGPPLVATFQAMRMEPAEFRATLQAAFTAQTALVVAGYLITGQYAATSLAVLAVAIPALVVGWFVGNRLFHALPTSAYFRIILVTLALSGTLTLVRAL